jgi:glutaminyl-peptide cyclotransferase
MKTPLTLTLLLLVSTTACAQTTGSRQALPVVSGEQIMDYVRTQVAFGPRPSGSPALQKCREWLLKELRGFGYEVEDDAFDAQTPYGTIRMHNLIARKGTGGKGVVALASHYETKLMERIDFVGANDGGSSTGLLLELARVLAGHGDSLDYWFVFLDGEEAFVEWSTFDSTYGSRHLAKRWKQDGTAGRIKALVLLDMIGDRNLGLYRESNSTPWLMDLVWNSARENGLGDILSNTNAGVEDDHIPFLDAGIPSVDLIDLDYPPWHTEGDTIDKLSAENMAKVGRLVLAVLMKLQEKFRS